MRARDVDGVTFVYRDLRGHNRWDAEAHGYRVSLAREPQGWIWGVGDPGPFPISREMGKEYYATFYACARAALTAARDVAIWNDPPRGTILTNPSA